MNKQRIDRVRVRETFRRYTEDYDAENPKIALKIRHTYRVADLSDRIAGSLGLSEEDRDLAWLIGMLHDVGRFEQVRRYHTFVDSKSVNHAHLSADLLFGEGLIRRFLPEEAESESLIETAIRLHNAYYLPEDLSDRERVFCQVIRDADKVDILRVMVETPFSDLFRASMEEFLRSEISDEVYRDAVSGRTVNRKNSRTTMDYRVGHIALVFGLVYPESRRLVREQGFLRQLLETESRLPQTQERLQRIRERVELFLAEDTAVS